MPRVFGKTMESLRKRCNVDLIFDKSKAAKLLRQPSVKRFYIVSDDLAIVERYKRKIVLDRPIYCGFVILGTYSLNLNHAN